MIETTYKIKTFIFPVIFFITGFCVGQTNNLIDIKDLINQWELKDAINKIDKLQSSYDRNSYVYLKSIYYQAKILKRQDNHGLAFKKFLEARKGLRKLDSLYSVSEVNFEIFDLLDQQNDLKINKATYGKEFIDFALSKKNTSSLLRARAHLINASLSWDIESIDITINHYKRSILELKRKPYPIKIAAVEMNIGSVYKDQTEDNDSACYYYDKSLYFFKQNNIPSLEDICYNNLAELYEKMGNHFIAANYFEKSNNGTDVKEYNIKTRAVIYKNKISSFKNLNNKDSILKYSELLHYVRDSIGNQSQQEALIKYQASEKEKQIIKEKSKTKQITIALASILLLGSIIALLVYRNTKRKQRIAEQDRELQIQKTETILKEKELETINAMVSGQEKERLRLAGELHDNLGSTLATVRMQVENLERNLDKVDDPKALLQKTNVLVNEAYDKVRSISHQRNSGVMAKDGLLPAVQKLARTLSSNNQLQVDVQDFGLENRIPNELEITIFRIIQELVTNIIKHAQASEANISLTQHDNELNIMVEDNGKGFKVGKLQEKDGMGLGNIERRIEHLEGTMEVDSMPGRGTSVSIDIPLQQDQGDT